MNFRTVFDAPIRILQLGTVVGRKGAGGDTMFFLCMRPRCDSIRLDSQEAELFLLLRLINPLKKTIQIVLKPDKSAYRRVSVCTDMSQWSLEKFNPNSEQGVVVAEKEAGGFVFTTSTNNIRFEWIGELKAEFAQRVAQEFASGLSRIAVDNSEWLRRYERH